MVQKFFESDIVQFVLLIWGVFSFLSIISNFFSLLVCPFETISVYILAALISIAISQLFKEVNFMILLFFLSPFIMFIISHIHRKEEILSRYEEIKREIENLSKNLRTVVEEREQLLKKQGFILNAIKRLENEHEKIKKNKGQALKYKQKILEELFTSKGIEFERAFKKLLEAAGYVVKTTPKSGDFGADLIAKKNKKIVIQLKGWEKPIGIKAIQEVYAASAYYKANEAWVVTNSTFTKSSKKLAKECGVKLFNKNNILEAIDRLLELVVLSEIENKINKRQLELERIQKLIDNSHLKEKEILNNIKTKKTEIKEIEYELKKLKISEKAKSK